MRKKRLLLLDRDPEYAARFAGYGNQRESLLLEILPFTDRQELDRFLEGQPADAALVPPEEAGNSVYEGLQAGDEVSLDYVVRTDYLKPQGNKDPIQLTCLHIRGIRTLISEGGR